MNVLLKNRVANTVIAMPSLTSQALTQANRDCVIRTVTGRARRDEKDRANAMTRRESRKVEAGRGTLLNEIPEWRPSCGYPVCVDYLPMCVNYSP